MELLVDFARFRDPNEIGLGVHDIHSPRGPTREEMAERLLRAGMVLPAARLWVNPDCGLKTRGWPEVEAAKSARHHVAGMTSCVMGRSIHPAFRAAGNRISTA